MRSFASGIASSSVSPSVSRSASRSRRRLTQLRKILKTMRPPHGNPSRRLYAGRFQSGEAPAGNMTGKKRLLAVHVLKAGQRRRRAVAGRDFAGVDRGGRALRKAEGEQGTQ